MRRTLRFMLVPLGQIILSYTVQLDIRPAKSTLDMSSGRRLRLRVIQQAIFSLCGSHSAVGYDTRTPLLMSMPISKKVGMIDRQLDPFLAGSTKNFVWFDLLSTGILF
jgi:hypothetical protein